MFCFFLGHLYGWHYSVSRTVKEKKRGIERTKRSGEKRGEQFESSWIFFAERVMKKMEYDFATGCRRTRRGE